VAILYSFFVIRYSFAILEEEYKNNVMNEIDARLLIV
jgi:hypothetical protein